MNAIPIKNTKIDHLFELVIFPMRNKRYPTIIFSIPHKTFVVGDDNPLPGGLAKGVGNPSPEIPCIKCGREFTRNIPAKKQAI